MTNQLAPNALEQVRGVIQNAHYVMLSTLTPVPMPDTRAMLNLRNPADYPTLQKHFQAGSFDTYLTTNLSSAKMGHIQANANASLYYFDEKTIRGVTLFGVLQNITDQHTLDAFWLDDWAAAYPGGRHGGDFAMLFFKAKRLKYYDGAFHKYEIALP